MTEPILPPFNFLKAKGYTISWNWWDTWQEAHAKAFTVAKAARMDILQDIRAEVQKALDDGITFQQFKKELEPRLKAKGWWGKTMVGDGHGGAEDVQLGSPYRLKTIYMTNLQTAYNAGRYKAQMENTDNRPYWQYTAVLDARTRPAHRALNGQTFRYDDPFWSTHYPPLGFRCRCRVRALSATDVTAKGITVESAEGRITWEDALVSKRTGALEPVAVYHDPHTGKAIPTDVGWSYNPGRESWFPNLDTYDYPVAQKWVEGGLTGPDFKAFFDGAIKGNFPVAVLDDAYKRAIGAKSQTVYMSDETLIKNKTKHPDIEIDIYKHLPDIIATAQLVVQDGKNTFVFFKMGGKIYYGAIKTTGTGETNFLISLRLARKDDIETIKKKGKILKNEL